MEENLGSELVSIKNEISEAHCLSTSHSGRSILASEGETRSEEHLMPSKEVLLDATRINGDGVADSLQKACEFLCPAGIEVVRDI